MSIWDWVVSRDGRKWVYTISLALIPLLVFYGVISEDAAPLWLALIGAVIAPVMALTHMTPVDNGPDDGPDIPSDVPQVVDLDVEE
jgi:hypothetical protein